MAGIISHEKAEMLTLVEFISALSTDADCRSVFNSNAKPNTPFNVDSDGVLVRVCNLDGE